MGGPPLQDHLHFPSPPIPMCSGNQSFATLLLLPRSSNLYRRSQTIFELMIGELSAGYVDRCAMLLFLYHLSNVPCTQLSLAQTFTRKMPGNLPIASEYLVSGPNIPARFPSSILDPFVYRCWWVDGIFTPLSCTQYNEGVFLLALHLWSSQQSATLLSASLVISLDLSLPFVAVTFLQLSPQLDGGI